MEMKTSVYEQVSSVLPVGRELRQVLYLIERDRAIVALNSGVVAMEGVRDWFLAHHQRDSREWFPPKTVADEIQEEIDRWKITQEAYIEAIQKRAGTKTEKGR